MRKHQIGGRGSEYLPKRGDPPGCIADSDRLAMGGSCAGSGRTLPPLRETCSFCPIYQDWKFITCIYPDSR